jgi:hypothetical protein
VDPAGYHVYVEKMRVRRGSKRFKIDRSRSKSQNKKCYFGALARFNSGVTRLLDINNASASMKVQG